MYKMLLIKPINKLKNMPKDKSPVKNNLYDFDNYTASMFNLRYWIIGLTFATTALLIVFALTKTPIYQASSKVIVGTYQNAPFECALNKQLQERCSREIKPDSLFMHSEDLKNSINQYAKRNFENEILIINNENFTLDIISKATSRDEAKTSLQKIDKFVSQLNFNNIENVKSKRKEAINNLKKHISDITNFQISPLQQEILLELSMYDEKIIAIEKVAIPLYESTIKKMALSLSKDNFAVDKINLNKIYQTGSLELGEINTISLRMEERHWLRKFNSTAFSELLRLEEKLNFDRMQLRKLIIEKNEFIKVTTPKIKQEISTHKIEIENLEFQINEYTRLNSFKSYQDTGFIGKIDAPEKQISPNIKNYTLFGFLGSLSLFLFIFSLLTIVNPKKENL